MTSTRAFATGTVFVATALIGTNLTHAGPGAAVYIPTGENAEVLVIDTASHQPIGQVAGLPAAHGLAVTSKGDRLIVGSFDERKAGEATPEKPAGVSAVDHEAHHAPKSAAVTTSEVSTLSIVDTATRSIVRRIDVPGAVHHVAVSPDDRMAVVTHPNSNSVTAIDLGAFAVVATVQTGETPNYVAFSKDGRKVYVSDAGEDSVAVLDSSTWSITNRVPVGESPEHLALSPDGRMLFVNNVSEGSVSVIDLRAEKTVDTLPIGEVLHGVDISDDGATLFVAVRGDDKLVAINLGDGDQRSVALAPAPYHLSVIRGAGVLYVSSAEEPVVWVVETATLRTVAEIAVPGTGHQFGQAAGG